MKARWRYVVLLAVLLTLLAPLYVTAASNPDIIAILKSVIDGVIAAGKDAYCASGVAALCK